MLLELSYRHAE